MAGKIGSIDVIGSYLGDVEVTKVYLGTELVAEFDPEPTPHVLTPVDMEGFTYHMDGDDAIITKYVGEDTDVTVPNV